MVCLWACISNRNGIISNIGEEAPGSLDVSYGEGKQLNGLGSKYLNVFEICPFRGINASERLGNV